MSASRAVIILLASGLLACSGGGGDGLQKVCEGFRTELSSRTSDAALAELESAEPGIESVRRHRLMVDFGGRWTALGFEVCFPAESGTSARRLAYLETKRAIEGLLLQLEAARRADASPGDRIAELRGHLGELRRLFEVE